MKPILRYSKPALLTVIVALSGLAVAATTAPGAQAVSWPVNPHITTSVVYYGSPEQATVNVQGAGFTPSGSVTVEEYDDSWHEITSFTVTASPFSCTKSGMLLICIGGAVAQGFWFPQPPATPKTYNFIAYDAGSGRWSNWASQSIG